MTAASSNAGRRNWRMLAWVIPIVIVAGVLIVLLARFLRDQPSIESFIHTYPGQSALPSWAPVGFPGWLAWQHGLNAFFLLLIIRTGWQVRTQRRPEAFWTRNNRGLIHTRREPKKISIMLWLHLSLDTLWVLNGIVFYILIFSTGQWTRIVPLRWDFAPNALSTAIQYASLNWPVETGWTNYNSLQVVSYFLIVFIAAPLAIITGLRMSPLWPTSGRAVTAFPIGLARRLHFPTMVFFVLFVVVHVILVLSTGALNNLNHMYAVRNDESWIGFAVFMASLVVMVAAWIFARPIFLRPIAASMGKVTSR